MIALLVEHLKASEVKVRFEPVTLLDYQAGEFMIKTESAWQSASRVIIASGTVPITSDLPSVSDLAGRRVFYEVKDLRGVTGKHIAIIGGGDAAFDYALTLAAHNMVAIFNRSERISCLQLLSERAGRNASIEVKSSHKLVRVESFAEGLLLKWARPGGYLTEQKDYLLFAIGRRPNLEFVSPGLTDQMDQLEEMGLMFRIGDVKNGLYRQLGISVGDGIKAAMSLADESKSGAK